MQADNRRDISVIIPVYGVERFVEACVRSLMEQTLREGVEFIFVDDATPDASIDTVRRTVADYPDRAAQVKILTHSRNRGLPSARNTGLEAACGEYVVHIDSDDFAEPQMLEAMLDEARRSGADMVWCDWYLWTDNGERRMPTPDISDAREAMMAMLGGTMKFNVWNKLTRRSIFTGNALRFPDGYPMGEDMTMIRACARCRMTAHVGRPLYHYRRTNSGAMTQAYSDALFSQLRGQVADLEAENERLRNQAPKVDRVAELIAAGNVIFFKIDTWEITEKSRASRSFLADAIKNTKGVYSVTGYADKGTGTPQWNEDLSKKRAEAAYNCLVNEFGVPADRLSIHYKGGVDDMFYNDPRCSRCVIVIPEE